MAGAEKRRAHSLDEVQTFLLEDFNLEPIFYSSEIDQRRSDSCSPTVSFDCLLERRRRESVDASLSFEIATVEVLVGVVTSLVKCSTWTHAKFQFGCGAFVPRDVSSELVFESLLFEVGRLLGTSPSLLCLEVSCNKGYARARYENRSETLTVHDAPAERGPCGTNFPGLAEALAGGMSRNSALKSLTMDTSHNFCQLVDETSLEVLFTSTIMLSVKEVVLSFPNCVAWNNCATVVNLVRWNTALEKLTLCSTDSWSRLKDVTYTWTSENHGRALQVKYSETDFILSTGLIEPLTAKFSQDCSPDSIFARGSDLSTLHLILSLDQGISSYLKSFRPREWVQPFRDNMVTVVRNVASMSATTTTLNDVQVSYEWGPTKNNLIWSCQTQGELLTLTWGSNDVVDAESLELLIASIITSSVRELVLRFSNCVPWNNCASVVNLVRWNTTLEKLTLCSTDSSSGLKEVTYIWTLETLSRDLLVKCSGTEFILLAGLLEPMAAEFSLEAFSLPSSSPCGTDLSPLHLVLSIDQGISSNRRISSQELVQTFRDSLIALVTSVTSMSTRCTTLMDVEESYNWVRDRLPPKNELMWSFEKQAELLTLTWGFKELVDAKSLELLYASVFMSSVKDMVLRFPDCVPWNDCDAVVNLVRWNTTLEKLTLCSSGSSSWLKDVTYSWTSENLGRALQVKYYGKDSTLQPVLVEPLAAKFSQDYTRDSILSPRTDICTLHLIFSSDRYLGPQEWEQSYKDKLIALVTSLASMSARSSTLKHVQVSYEWAKDGLPPYNNLIWRCQKQAGLLTLTWDSYDFSDAEAMVLLFPSVLMGSVRELVLRFPDCFMWNKSDSLLNLVRWNTTLTSLTLCSTESSSRLKDVTYTWTSENNGRALQVKFSGMDFFLLAGHIEPLAVKFSQDYNPDRMFHCSTHDLSSLHVTLSLDQGNSSNCNLSPRQWVQTFGENMIALVTSVATMAARSTFLKHVRLSFEWGNDWSKRIDWMWSARKQVELSMQEVLREMVENELRGNTSLETLEVGFWKLIRRAQHMGGGIDEWHMSYGGPCLSSTISNEYVVKVQM